MWAVFTFLPRSVDEKTKTWPLRWYRLSRILLLEYFIIPIQDICWEHSLLLLAKLLRIENLSCFVLFLLFFLVTVSVWTGDSAPYLLRQVVTSSECRGWQQDRKEHCGLWRQIRLCSGLALPAVGTEDNARFSGSLRSSGHTQDAHTMPGIRKSWFLYLAVPTSKKN